ncbi:MAG: M23 family metallopeptidase, partial [Clostridia bacterium]|nr:M23 family metallopeptidase [Clostridia bacterium]
MKEAKAKSKKRLLYYVILGISVLLIAAATVLTVYFVSGRSDSLIDNPSIDNPNDNNPVNPDDNKPGNPDDNKPNDNPVGGGDVTEPKYVAPLASVKYSLPYNEIYSNQTVGWYYRHQALDFAAEVGTEVYAMADGEVETVSYNDKTGNYIIV